MHPETLGSLKVIESLGKGGMGEVFLALDEPLQRQVAVKRLQRSGGPAKERQRLLREARALARLNHRSIVQIHQAFEEGGALHLVMEYVKGKTVARLLRSSPLPLHRAVRIAREVAAGLGEAHAQGIVHRDLKAENIMITRSKEIKILDFGMAKLIGTTGSMALTATGTLVGTCRAMSPEQARGNEVDGRSDLFSLGVLLYEMTTGKSPFLAESRLATLSQICTENPPPVTDLRPEIPGSLSALIQNLLAKEILQRPPSADWVVQTLDRIAKELPAAHPAAATAEPSKPVAETPESAPQPITPSTASSTSSSTASSTSSSTASSTSSSTASSTSSSTASSTSSSTASSEAESSEAALAAAQLAALASDSDTVEIQVEEPATADTALTCPQEDPVPATNSVATPRRRQVTLWRSLAVVLACGLVAEMLLRTLAPIADPYERYKHTAPINRYITSEFDIGYRVTTVAEAGLPGLSGEKTFSVNNLGFRGDFLTQPKPADEFRIFMLGGSTLAGFFLDDSESVGAVLQAELGNAVASPVIKVYSAAKAGQSLDDQLALLSHRIVHLQADLIVSMVGLEDLAKNLDGHDPLHFINPSRERYPLLKFVATEFQIPRRLYYWLKSQPSRNRFDQDQQPIETNYQNMIAAYQRATYTDRPIHVDSAAFATNLRSIAGLVGGLTGGLSGGQGVPLVLITQQTTWNSDVDATAKDHHWLTFGPGEKYPEEQLEAALENLNEIIREFALEQDLPLLDLPQHVAKSNQFFYDQNHFNVQGAAVTGQLLADLLADLLRERGLIQAEPTG